MFHLGLRKKEQLCLFYFSAKRKNRIFAAVIPVCLGAMALSAFSAVLDAVYMLLHHGEIRMGRELLYLSCHILSLSILRADFPQAHHWSRRSLPKSLLP